MKTNKFLQFAFLFLFSTLLLPFNSCSKDDDEDFTFDNNDEYYEQGGSSKNDLAPQSLSIGYTFGTGTGNVKTDKLFFKIKSATKGQHGTNLNSGDTDWSYTKTGSNTATFSCTCKQNINGPIRVRTFVWKGTLTYLSKDKCKYEAERTYYADGVYQGATKESYTLYIYHL